MRGGRSWEFWVDRYTIDSVYKIGNSWNIRVVQETQLSALGNLNEKEV